MIVDGSTKANFEHLDRNEDAYFISEDGMTFGVFDGLGGQTGGAFAANLAKEEVEEAMSRGLSLVEALDLAHKALFEARRGDTTGLVVKIKEVNLPGFRGTKLTYANVGDGRLYLFRQGEMKLITDQEEKSLKMKEKVGKIDRGEARKIGNLDSWEEFEALSQEARLYFLTRNILNESMLDYHKPEEGELYLERGDVVLAMTDGIYDNLTKEGMRRSIAGLEFPDDISSKLIEVALEKSRLAEKEVNGRSANPRAKPDDLTVAVAVVL